MWSKIQASHWTNSGKSSLSLLSPILKGERVRIREIYMEKGKKTQTKVEREKRKTQKVRRIEEKYRYQFENSQEFENRAISKLVGGNVRLNRPKF